MIISHKHKFIYFRPNGRCGTTSVENALREYHEGPERYLESKGNTNLMHLPPRLLFLNPKNRILMNYHKIAVVRNPYDWFLALHRHAILDKKEDIVVCDERKNKYYTPTAYKCDSPKGSFDMKRIDEVLALVHIVSYINENQLCGLCFRGKFMVDSIIKFESLQRDFDSTMDKLGLPRKKLEHARKKLDYDERKHYSYYYSNDAMKAVEGICDFDFNAFGYEKESV